MTTPTGTITMLDVILELDGVATPRQITLNDADVRGLAEVPAGQISMDDLRGKSNKLAICWGTITVGDAGGEIGFRSNAGSLDTVFYDVSWDGVVNPFTQLAWLDNPLSNTASFSDPNEVLANRFTSLTIEGNGRIVDMEIPANFTGFGTTSQSESPYTVALFTVADVGLSFAFTIYE